MVMRKYQETIVGIAEVENTLVILPTGAGKTLIAANVIKRRILKQRLAIKNDPTYEPKLIAFVAPTKILVGQQCNYIEHVLGTSFCKMKAITGDNSGLRLRRKSADSWNLESWKKEVHSAEVIVITPEILRQRTTA